MSEQKTKHIPGPWAVEHPYGEGGIYVSQTNTALIAKVCYGQEANARLIAAAPDLLALAARGASLADAVADSAYDVGKHTEDIRRLAYWALDARSAIRAAEGEG